eukprot:759669-Hanusia_phi.AAC.5
MEASMGARYVEEASRRQADSGSHGGLALSSGQDSDVSLHVVEAVGLRLRIPSGVFRGADGVLRRVRSSVVVGLLARLLPGKTPHFPAHRLNMDQMFVQLELKKFELERSRRLEARMFQDWKRLLTLLGRSRCNLKSNITVARFISVVKDPSVQGKKLAIC